jgi:hypothetical protein
MPSYRTAFPSKYTKADDLGTSRPIGTIANVDFETVGSGANTEQKLVVHFREPLMRPMIMNLVNSDSIAEISGTDDYSKWPGTKVQLYVTKTEFQGKRIPCVRIQAPEGKKPKTLPKTLLHDDIDDAMPTVDEPEQPF